MVAILQQGEPVVGSVKLVFVIRYIGTNASQSDSLVHDTHVNLEVQV